MTKLVQFYLLGMWLLLASISSFYNVDFIGLFYIVIKLLTPMKIIVYI